MSDYLKRLAAKLPPGLQWELKKLRYGRQIKKSRFSAGEPENAILDRYLRPGDWVVDVGANVGHYAWQFSNLVGPSGRVVAIEPVPATFGLLTVNAHRFPNRNVTLLNVALSDRTQMATMLVPQFASGLQNFYQATLEASTEHGERCSVITLPFDSLGIEHRVALIKIDVEGHDEPVLAGMMRTLQRDKPVLIVEAPAPQSQRRLASLGYRSETLPGSPNTLFTAGG